MKRIEEEKSKIKEKKSHDDDVNRDVVAVQSGDPIVVVCVRCALMHFGPDFSSNDTDDSGLVYCRGCGTRLPPPVIKTKALANRYSVNCTIHGLVVESEYYEQACLLGRGHVQAWKCNGRLRVELVL